MKDISDKNPKLSALVVVHNEEQDLETCLQHLLFVDEIVVLLDRCTDNSKNIAEQYAHKIVEGAWEFEGDRRNTGIDSCTGPWIIDADADEWISDELADEIRETIKTTEYDIFDIPVRNYIGGHLVKYGWGGGSFGKVSYLGLYRSFAKRYGAGRHHAHVEEQGKRGPDLKSPLEAESINPLYCIRSESRIWSASTSCLIKSFWLSHIPRIVSIDKRPTILSLNVLS